MKEMSVMNKRISKEKYKEYNNSFPSIEGYLFKKLDEILLYCDLTGVRYSIYFGERYCRACEFLVIKSGNYSIGIVLDFSQKRIGVKLSNKESIYSGTLELEEKIKKELNITKSNIHKQNYYMTYNFKYNYRNCQRIVDMIKIIM